MQIVDAPFEFVQQNTGHRFGQRERRGDGGDVFFLLFLDVFFAKNRERFFLLLWVVVVVGIEGEGIVIVGVIRVADVGLIGIEVGGIGGIEVVGIHGSKIGNQGFEG